jgi:translocation and assembly module TamB
MRRVFRTIAIIAGALAALVVLGGVGLLGFLGSESGASWVEARLNRELASPDQTIRLSGLTGPLPFTARIAEIEIADKAGTWLKLDDVVVELRAMALLGGTVRIDRVAAGSVEMLRAPAPTATAPPPEPAAPAEKLRISLPHLPVAVELGNVSVALLKLDPPVAGTAVALAADGSASLHDGAGRIVLAIRRTDGTPGSLDLHAAYGPAANGPEGLDLTLHATDPSGVFLAGLGQPSLPAVLDLNGAGPLADWHGTLTASAGTDSGVTATLAIGRRGTDTILSVDGGARVASLVAERLKPAVGEEIRFDIGAAIAAAGAVRLDRARIAAGAGTITGTGGYDPASGGIQAEIQATADLATLGPATGAALAGSTTLDLTLSGTIDRPTARLTLHGGNLAVDATTVRSLDATIQAAPAASGRIGVSGSGRIAGLSAPNLPPGAHAGDGIDWSLDLSTDWPATVVELSRITVEGAGLDVQGTGRLDHGTLTGHLALAAADLSRLSTMAGAAHLTVDATSPDGRSASARLSGTLTGFRSGMEEADAVLGSEISIDAAAARGASGIVDLSALAVTGAHASLHAAGRYDPTSGTGTAHAALALPDLSPIAAAAGTTGAGRLDLAADLDGPKALVTLTGTVVAGAARIDRIDARIAVDDLARRSARLTATASSGKMTAKLSADLAQTGDQLYAIDHLLLTAPGTELQGRIAADRAAKRVTGSLQAHIADLSPWSGMTGQPMAGRADLKLDLGAAKGQTADATLTADGLVLGQGTSGIRLGHLAADAHVAGLAGTPSGDADLTLTQMAAGKLRLDAGSVSAKAGRAGTFEVGLSGNGAFTYRKFTVNAGGTVASGPTGQHVTLARLAGAVGDLGFRLRQTMTASRDGRAFAIDGLSLDVAKGRIEGQGRYDGGTLAVALRATDLSIADLASIDDRRDLTGTLGFDIAVNGPVGDPRGHEVVSLRQLKFTGEGARTQPVDFSASADLVAGAALLKGRIDSASNSASLGFSASLPLAFAGFVPALRPDGALQAKLEGDGRFEPLNELLPIGEDSMGGSYAVDLAVGGTVAAPEAGGRLTVSDGSYDNAASGMTLRHLNLELTGDRRQFTLTRFEATDGGDGTLAVSGKVDLGAAGGPIFDMAATLAGFSGARSDLVTAIISGTARVSGNIAQPKVTGDLSIDHADINLAQPLPPNIVVLDVVRIDSSHPAPPPPAVPPPAPPVAALLDLKLHAANRIFVRGNGIDSEWKADIAVGGTSASPSVTGQLNSLNGTYSLLGTDFTISRGNVYFAGPPEPSFDIEAQAATSSITATIDITGTPKQPKLALSSVPALPQDEVLSQVMFGSSTTQLTPAQGLELAQAAAGLAGGGGPGVLDRLRAATGLDRLSVGKSSAAQQANSAQSGGVASGTSVSGGKYVAPGVYVGAEQSLGGGTRARVEVMLTPHITATATTGAGGSQGSSLGVQYQLDY